MKKIHIILLFLTVGVAFQSCKKYFDPPLVFEKDPGSGLTKTRKVMLISIDGLSGVELKKHTPDYIRGILKNSKYTFDGFTDEHGGDATTWVTMLSGKNHRLHGVKGNDFEQEIEEDPDDPHGEESDGTSTGFITVFQRLLESGRRLHSMSVTSWPELDKNVFGLSDQRIVAGNDELVVDSTVNALKEKGDDLSFVTISFRELIEVGQQVGFSVDHPEFKETLERIDSYIERIINVVKERESYGDEDWLFIITSNHGAKEDSFGGTSFEERNVFSIYYNERFEERGVDGDFMDYIRLHGWWPNESLTTGGQTITTTEMGVHAEGSGGNSEDIFNISHTGELTVEFKVNFHSKLLSHPNASGWGNTFQFNHQNLISKDQEGSTDKQNGASTPGWTITPYQTGSYMISLSDGQENHLMTVNGRENQVWQHIAVTFDGSKAGTTKVTFYIDGEKVGSETFDVDASKFDNNDPLVLGFQRKFNYGLLDVLGADFRFWNRSLTEEEISKVACLTTIPGDDTLYDNMISYYRKANTSGKFSNEVTDAPDLTLTGNYEFATAPNHTVCDDAYIFGTMDLAPQVYYWLELDTDDSWDLEGKVFLDGYEKEFITN